jgi:opacity protein-like surface antigen
VGTTNVPAPDEPRLYSLDRDVLALESLEASRSYGSQDEPLVGVRSSDHTGWYIGVGFGITTTTDSDGPDEDIEFDEGWALPIAIGCHHTGEVGDALSWDFEVEGLYTDQDADDDPPLEAVRDITVAAALLNGILNVNFAENWAIYGGAGIGAAWLDIGTESDNLHDFEEDDGPFLAWQGKAGLRWWATDRLSWNLGYRFLNVDDAEIDDDIGNSSFDLETQQHILEIGVRLLF